MQGTACGAAAWTLAAWRAAWSALLIAAPWPASAGAGRAEVSVAEFFEVRPRHLRLVDARGMVDFAGEPSGAAAGSWTLDLQPPAEGALAPPAASPALVFVHGFNTRLPGALGAGLALERHVGAAHAALRPGSEAPHVFIFAWRGDFGFGAAQRAADLTAPALADFLDRLRAGGARIVLLAHSLGARLALEALRLAPSRSSEPPLVSALVLVQAAVPATSIYKWTATDILSPQTPVDRCAGRYADVIGRAGRLVYTVAERDDVLRNLFSTKEWHVPQALPCFLPFMDGVYKFPFKSDAVRASALGSPFGTEGVLECIPKTPLPMDDGSRLGRRIPRGDSWERDAPVLGPLECQAIYRFEFRIEHGEVARLDAAQAIGRGGERVDWHSPVFEASGAALVQEIWRRIVQDFPQQ